MKRADSARILSSGGRDQRKGVGVLGVVRHPDQDDQVRYGVLGVLGCSG